jgi:HlyD family secretion protein
MVKKNIKKIIIPLVIIIAGIIIMIVFIKKDSSDNTKIKGSGTIEVVEINVSSKIMGRIKTFSINEGDRVSNQQILAKIESDEVGAKYDEANALYSQSIERLQSAGAALSNSEKDLKRYRELFKAGSIARMQLDNVETKYKTDAANYRSAVAGVERAKSALSLARYFSKEYIINSPLNGTVLKKYFEPGELVMPGSILLSLGDLKNVYLKIYIPEYKLGMIKAGQKVKVKTDTYKNKTYYGKITQISQKAEFTPKNIQTEEERVRLVFGVKVSINNDNFELKPGMPADAEIIIE